MLREVTLSLDPSPFFGDMREVASSRGAEITIEDCNRIGTKKMMLRANIEASHGNAEDVVEALRKLPSVKRVYSTSGRRTQSSCIITLNQPRICRATRKAGIFCLTCAYNTAGSKEGWRLLARSSQTLRQFLKRLEGESVAVTIRGVSSASEEIDLTSRQSEVVAKAASLGYFDFPRKNDSHFVAKALGIKPATFSEIMRAAERRMVERYMHEVKSKAVRPGTPGSTKAKPSADQMSQS